MNILRTIAWSAAIITLSLTSCDYDTLHEADALDVQLKERLRIASPTGNFEHFILPSGTDYENIPQEPTNPLTPEKIALGKYLFFETGIGVKAAKASGMGTYSCATCHVPTAGFRPGRHQGIADGGVGFGENGEFRELNPEYNEDEIDAQGARPLSVLNVAYVTNTFWNGQFGAGHINEGTESRWNHEDATDINELGMLGPEVQNIEGLEVHRMEMTEELAEELGYRVLFDLAFGDVPRNERYSNHSTAMALSAYIRTLLPNRAPFQDWLKGDYNAMSDSEKRGAILFFNEARCYTCHYSPGLNSMEFHALGVYDLHQTGGLNTSEDDRRHLGRGGFTGKAEDLYKFKVPQLYNLADAPFFFHGSSKETLEEVVDYKDLATGENPNVPTGQISDKFRPIGLSDAEKQDLLEFLKKALRDPYLNRYVPPFVQSGNCFPNNDPLSVEQMGCE